MIEQSINSVLLYRAKDMIEGSMLVAMLEESGVRAWTVGGQGNIGLGDLPSDCLLIDVCVEGADHEKGISLVKEYFARPQKGAACELQPWTCTSCGETVDGSFTACWNCSANRGALPAKPADSAPPIAPAELTSPMNTRWSSWQVRALRTYLLYLGLGVMAVAPTALRGLVDDTVLLWLSVAGCIGLLYVGLRWALGYKDVPADRDADA